MGWTDLDCIAGDDIIDGMVCMGHCITGYVEWVARWYGHGLFLGAF